MKYKFILLPCLMAAIVFAGCATTTDTATPTNFTSQTQADNAVALNEGYIFSIVELATTTADEATDFNGSFTNVFLKHGKALRKTSVTNVGGYNSGTGFWTYDSTSGDSIAVHYKIKFTPRNIFGLPDSTTTDMTYSLDVFLKFVDGFNIFNFDYSAAMDMTGIAAYRAHTGNATADGSFDFSIGIHETSPQNISLDYAFTSLYKALVISPTATYRLLSGSVDFTLKFDYTPSIPGLNYYVAGTLTFHGTQYVSLSIGGYNYTVDLLNQTITPA